LVQLLLMRHLSIILFLIVSLLYASDLEFDSTGSPYDMSYNSFSNSRTRSTVPIMIRNNSEEKLDAFITVSKGNANDQNYDRLLESIHVDDQLNYQLYSSSSAGDDEILRELEDIESEDNVLQVSNIKSGKTKKAKMFVSIPASQYVDVDTYTDTFILRLYKGEYGSESSYELMDQSSFSLNVDVEKNMLMSLIGSETGDEMYIDFDVIESEESTQFRLYFEANSDFEVYAQSVNHQELRHTNPDISAALGYTFFSNKGTYDLSQGDDVLIFSRSVKREKIYNHRYTIQLDAFTILTEGVYSDTIYLTMQNI